MKRREFISLLGGVAIALPLASRAEAARVPKVGFLYPGPQAVANERATHVLEGLRSEGSARRIVSRS